MPDGALPIVRPSVDASVLRSARAFFPNTLESILVELVQNARRAGATRLDITLDQEASTLTVADNGKGLAPDDFASLLRLGRSGWSGDTAAFESPAGMGFYSLSLRDSTIESNGLRLALTPANFVDQDAVLERLGAGTPAAPGTRLTFSLSAAEAAGDLGDKWQSAKYAFFGEDDELVGGAPNALFSLVQSLVQTLPQIETYLQGNLIQAMPLVDFLNTKGKIVDTFEIDGNLFHLVLKSYLQPSVHFHGRFVELQNLPTAEIDWLEPAKTIAFDGFVADTSIRHNNDHLSFVVDVQRTDGLLLTLPNRDALVENTAYERMCAAFRTAVDRHVNGNPVSWAEWRFADRGWFDSDKKTLSWPDIVIHNEPPTTTLLVPHPEEEWNGVFHCAPDNRFVISPIMYDKDQQFLKALMADPVGAKFGQRVARFHYNDPDHPAAFLAESAKITMVRAGQVSVFDITEDNETLPDEAHGDADSLTLTVTARHRVTGETDSCVVPLPFYMWRAAMGEKSYQVFSDFRMAKTAGVTIDDAIRVYWECYRQEQEAHMHDRDMRLHRAFLPWFLTPDELAVHDLAEATKDLANRSGLQGRNFTVTWDPATGQHVSRLLP